MLTLLADMASSDQLRGLGLVGLAGLLGGVVGIEREIRGKPAGLRTHIFVASAAAMLMILGEVMLRSYGSNDGNTPVAADPLRIVQAIVIGVSFLGAGTIIKQGEKIEGLTTAASILLVTGVGIGVALEQYLLATGVTVFAVVLLLLLGYVERRYLPEVRED